MQTMKMAMFEQCGLTETIDSRKKTTPGARRGSPCATAYGPREAAVRCDIMRPETIWKVFSSSEYDSVLLKLGNISGTYGC